MLLITALIMKSYAEAKPEWIGSESFYKLLVFLNKHKIRTRISKRKRNSAKGIITLSDRYAKGKKKKRSSSRINNLEKEIEYIRKRIIAVQSERNSLATDLAHITASLKNTRQN